MIHRHHKTCSADGESRLAYHSEYAALEAADHFRHAEHKDHIAYQCTACGEWHLSPVAEKMPSTPCPTCRDYMHRPKDLYASEELALARARLVEKVRGTAFNVSACPSHAGWHLDAA